MTLQELLKLSDIDKVWNIFKNIILVYVKNDHDFGDKEMNVTKDVFMKLYNDLISRNINKNKLNEFLVCIRYYDEFPEYINGKYADNYTYNCSIWKCDENYEHYSFTFVPWNKILGTTVCEKSIDDYGKETVCAYFIDELTEFGFDETTKSKNESKLKEKLDEVMREMESSNTISWNEIKEELYSNMDNDNEESERDLKHSDEMLIKNKEIYNDYLEYAKLTGQNKNNDSY